MVCYNFLLFKFIILYAGLSLVSVLVSSYIMLLSFDMILSGLNFDMKALILSNSNKRYYYTFVLFTHNDTKVVTFLMA